MQKYRPLYDHLMVKRPSVWTAVFSEIENILGAPLPASAFRYQAWWSNERNGHHVQAHSWLNAGYKTEGVDLAQRKVTFVKS